MARNLVIDFEDDFSVTTILSPVPTNKFLGILEKIHALQISEDSLRALYEDFAPYLVSWTADEPTTADGLMALDYNLAIAIVHNWAKGVRNAPLPLPLPSSDGTPSEEQPA